MAKKKETASVLSVKTLADGIIDMWIKTDLSRTAKPGQFIMIYPKDKSTLLPRPISICECERQGGNLRIVYRIAGKGTLEFSKYRAGDSIVIMGPVGNGFPYEENGDKKAILIGGGIGIPPMLELAKALKASNEIYLGYRNNQLFLYEDLSAEAQVYVATEDGSAGTKGNVLDAMRANGAKCDVIYACGPMPMLRAIKKYAEENNIEAYISLEERMACGVGACLGCVCKTTKEDHHSHVNNTRVCTNGPVFECREVEI